MPRVGSQTPEQHCASLTQAAASDRHAGPPHERCSGSHESEQQSLAWLHGAS